MEEVRAATDDDAPQLRQLSDALVGAVTAQRGGSMLVDPGVSPAELARRLLELLGDPHYLVTVGTIDGAVTGFAVCHVEELEGHGRRGILDACYTETEARGVGVGRLLLDRSLAWLRESGCTGVDGIALPGDRAAKNFFEAAGFKARMLTMYRELD